jgi:hypothetical protein
VRDYQDGGRGGYEDKGAQEGALCEARGHVHLPHLSGQAHLLGNFPGAQSLHACVHAITRIL